MPKMGTGFKFGKGEEGGREELQEKGDRPTHENSSVVVTPNNKTGKYFVGKQCFLPLKISRSFIQ